MSNASLLTICVPVFNAEAFINDFMQETAYCEARFIFVNDSSTDQSFALIQNWITKLELDAEIITLTHQSGAGNARNIALEKVKTEYVAFFDIDDKPQWRKINDTLEQLTSLTADIIYFSYRKFSKTGSFTPDPQDERVFSHPTPNKCDILSTSAYPWNRIYRISFIRKNGVLFSQSATHNDLYFVRAAELLSDNIYILSKSLYHYRVANSESTSGITDERRCALFNELSKLDHLCESLELTQKELCAWDTFKNDLIRWAEKKVNRATKFRFHKVKNQYLSAHPSPICKPTSRLKLLKYFAASKI